MQRSAAIGWLLILNIAFSSAVFLKKPNPNQVNVFAQLHSVEKNTFGKQILNTIELQLLNKTPLSEVAKLINEIKVELLQQQEASSLLNSDRSVECNSETHRLKDNINDAKVIRDDARENLSVVDSELKSLNDDIENKVVQLNIVSERVNKLEAARERDASAYEKRTMETNQVLEALSLIVEKVRGIHPEAPSEKVLAQLAKIGKTNPILSLVSVASSFSADSLKNLNKQFNRLVDSLTGSLNEDRLSENSAISDFNALLGELSSNKASLVNLKSSLTSERDLKEASHAFHSGRLNSSLAEISENSELLSRREEQCGRFEVAYKTETAARSKEVQLLEDVLNLVATKLETLKDYLKERTQM